jgi:hypothetical protein
MDDTNTWAPDATEIKDTITNTQDAAEPLTEQVDVKPAEAQTRPDMSVVRLIEEADHSSGKLVNLLAKHFPCFQDEGRFEGRKVRFLKRAQIFVADLWAAFNGTGYGEFYDIEHITMFAGRSSLVEPKCCTSGNSDTCVCLDYRVPQMLYNLGVITFSPPLESRLRRMEELKAGESWELQLRGCSIWAVEMIRRQIVQDHPEAESEVNAVLLDFLLYDLAKEFESTGMFRACGVFPAPSRSTDFKTGVQWMWRTASYTRMSNGRRSQVYPQTDPVTQVQKAYPITGHGAYGTSNVLQNEYKMVAAFSLMQTLSPTLLPPHLAKLAVTVCTVCASGSTHATFLLLTNFHAHSLVSVPAQ